MTHRLRIGAVAYLNTRPLVFGLEEGIAGDRITLSYDVPSRLAERMIAGKLDIALLPVIDLATIPELEIVPGLGIVTRGPARSVVLATRVPLGQVRRIALDPESHTSNALVRVLCDEVWRIGPEFAAGPVDLESALDVFDAAVRIGDKALFELPDEGVQLHDLGSAWTDRTGLPFVFAVWACRPGVLDREIYRALHESRRRGSKAIDRIAEDYTWKGTRHPDTARAYLRSNILYRLGGDEIRSLEMFFAACARLGLVDRRPGIRLAMQRVTSCHEKAAARAALAGDG